MADATPQTDRPATGCDTPGRRFDPMALGGMVTSPHHLATQSGVRVLRDGGTAVDAAIAVAATLAVVYPQMCSLGGDSFWLIWDAGARTLRALNASGRSGEHVTRARYADRGLAAIPPRGYLAANTVPGVVSGWELASRYAREHLGSTRGWPDLLADAIRHARDGTPVTPSLAHWLAIDTDPGDREFRALQRFEGFARTFLRPDGRPWALGQVLRQPELARTLETLARDGADAFYTGPIAQAIVADLAAGGGLLSAADFAEHRADWVEPISVRYRDTTAYNFPPNTQGMASLAILNILENIDLRAIPEGSADYFHLLIEATKQAFLDRDRWLTDPAFADIPLARLLSPEHGRAQAARIRKDRAGTDTRPLDPHGDTVWFGAIDARGHAVSVIQSIYHDFGSGIVPGGTGVILQNRGSFFSLSPDAANRLEPRKRCFHTLNPAMLFRDGQPWLIYGTMGGEGQPQTQAAIATRIVDYGMTPQEAVAAPRWLHGRTWGASSNDTKFESRIPAAVTDELARRGHPVKVVDAYTDTMGHAGAILIDPETGVRHGASDPRSDGLAAGY
jgi:gamma-glutamyltranspeptidase/glutathione hydrolase